MATNLIFACSPRKNGNSDILADTAAKILDDAGLPVEIIHLRDLAFSPCRACNGCFKDGGCVLGDEFRMVYPKLLEAEKIIIAAPIYFQSLGALAKAFIDRAQPFWATKYILKRNVIENKDFRSKRGTYALLCGGTDFPDTFTCAERTIKIFSLMLEAKYVGGVFFPSVDAKGDISKEQNLREKISTLLNL